MKKILLITLATTVVASSALADTNQFYLRADVGANMNTKQKIGEIKFKPKTSASIDFGVGYHLANNFRAELVFGHHFSPEMKGSESWIDIGGTDYAKIKLKAKIETLMAKIYYDAYDFEFGKLFLGTGVGLAQVSEKGTASGVYEGAPFSKTHKYKKQNNFAYSLAAGSSFKLTEGVNTDIQYNWSDYGHAKSTDDDKAPKRRGHAVKIGVRFDL